MAATNYPSSLDSTSNLPSSISETANLNSPNHADMHEVTNTAIVQIEEKVGTGDTTASTGAVLIGTGSGASAWDTSPTFLGDVTVGVNDTGHDVKFFGASADHWMLWDQAYDALVLTQDSGIYFYDRGGERIVAAGDGHLTMDAGTTLDFTAPTIDLSASTIVTIDGDVDLNGALDVSGTLKVANGSDSAPSLTFASDPDLGFFRSAANNMGFKATLPTVTSYTTLRRGEDASGRTLVIGADSSSKRYKENIENFTKSDWENVYNLQAVKFNWKEEINAQRTRSFGLIAEDVAEQIPELGVYRVVDSEGDTPVVDSVNYEQLCVYLLEVVKDLNSRLKTLEG